MPEEIRGKRVSQVKTSPPKGHTQDNSVHAVSPREKRKYLSSGLGVRFVSLRQMCLTMNIYIPPIVKHICRKGTLLGREVLTHLYICNSIGNAQLAIGDEIHRHWLIPYNSNYYEPIRRLRNMQADLRRD